MLRLKRRSLAKGLLALPVASTVSASDTVSPASQSSSEDVRQLKSSDQYVAYKGWVVSKRELNLLKDDNNVD